MSKKTNKTIEFNEDFSRDGVKYELTEDADAKEFVRRTRKLIEESEDSITFGFGRIKGRRSLVVSTNSKKIRYPDIFELAYIIPKTIAGKLDGDMVTNPNKVSFEQMTAIASTLLICNSLMTAGVVEMMGDTDDETHNRWLIACAAAKITSDHILDSEVSRRGIMDKLDDFFFCDSDDDEEDDSDNDEDGDDDKPSPALREAFEHFMEELAKGVAGNKDKND